MNKLLNFSVVMCLILSILSSCEKNDDDTQPIGNRIENATLQNTLEKMGYEFDKDNKLVMNEKATNTKALNLSNKALSSVKGIDIFPNLEEINLSGNQFSEFDFASLPKKITKIDLQGNKLYRLKNLAKERKLSKLYLPESAKYNTEEILAYYMANKGNKLDMKIKINNKLEEYTSLREIPDIELRKDLKENFPSVFTGDKIDLSKEMQLSERSKGLNLGEYYSAYTKDIKSLEGIQYIIGFKNFSGPVIISMPEGKEIKLGYIRIPEKSPAILCKNVTFTEKIDWSKGYSIMEFTLENCKGLKKVDFSYSKKLLIDGAKNMKGIGAINCPDLEEIILPKQKNANKRDIAAVVFKDLPKLKKLDISMINEFLTISESELNKLPMCKIEYPTKLTGTIDVTYSFIMDKEVSEKPETKAFIKKFKSLVSINIEEEDQRGKQFYNTYRIAYGNDRISSFAGEYSGILEPVMNGKRYDNVNSTFTIKQETNNAISIYLPPFKVGKMPGKLTINISNNSFSTDSNGNISFNGSQKRCVILKMGIIPFKYPGNYTGTIKNNKLHFFIHSEGSFLGIPTFKADVTFNGVKG